MQTAREDGFRCAGFGIGRHLLHPFFKQLFPDRLAVCRHRHRQPRFLPSQDTDLPARQPLCIGLKGYALAGLQVWRRHNGHKQHHFVFVTVSHDVAGLHKRNRLRIKNLAGNKTGWELQIHRGRQSGVSRLPVINVPSLGDAEMHPDKKLLPGNYSVCAGHKFCKNLWSGFRRIGFHSFAQSFGDKIAGRA